MEINAIEIVLAIVNLVLAIAIPVFIIVFIISFFKMKKQVSALAEDVQTLLRQQIDKQ